MSYAEEVGKLKKLMGKPDENANEVIKIADILLELDPTPQEAKQAHIDLIAKSIIKKTQNPTIKQKLEAVLEQTQSKPAASQSTPQTISRSESSESKAKREKIKSLFIKQLSEETSDDKKAKDIANQIEDELYQNFVKEEEYSQQANHLIMALKTKNTYFHFIKKLLSGALSPKDFATLTKEDLQTDEEKKKQEELEKKALDKTSTPRPKKVPSRQFQCPKCKSWETFFYQYQTRGGDEHMTNFVYFGKSIRSFVIS